MLMVTWNSILIAVSLMVAFIAAFTALDTAGRAALSRGRLAQWWLICGGITMGIGIWAMHFIGMLAMMMPMTMRYDMPQTVLSLGVAIVAAILAFAQGLRGTHLSRRRLVCATLILGSGVVAMHYIGMNALLISPAIQWRPLLVILSVIIAYAASGSALWLAFHLRQGENLLLMRICASLVMGIAIAGMHYTGMAAAGYAISSDMRNHGVSEDGLAIWVTVITLTILGLTLLISMLDSQLRAARLAAELKSVNNELQLLAMHDKLTALPNRVLLEQRLNVLIEQATRLDENFSLMFMDLDGFKAVNDTWGHHVGDRLLIAVAQRLLAQLNPDMLLARLGGDEFVLMCPQSNADQAAALAQNLVHAINAPFEFERYILRVSLSVGIAVFPLHGRSQQEIIFNADSAMYHTKNNGRNGWCLFESVMSVVAQRELALSNDLWTALEYHEMRLFYQPKFRAGGKQPIGFEALLRWQHPQRGLLLPDMFLPRAEKTGQIVVLGDWVIDEACRQLKQWHEEGHRSWNVSVNLSALQFHQRDLIDSIRTVLDRHQLPQGALTIEITENIVMRDPQFSQQRISELHRLGVRVAIDNFGIGYANLMHLKHFDASELKIDRALISRLRADSEDASVVSAMLMLAKTLNLRMVAEGVETEEQQQMLIGLGFDTMQGYLLGKPAPADSISEFMQANHSQLSRQSTGS